MKYILAVFAFSFILFSMPRTNAAQDTRHSLKSLAFMAGCWEMRVPGRKTLITEQWMQPEGDAMLGINRTLTNGKMSAFEFLRIVEKGNKLYYVALPSESDTPTSFELKSSGKGVVVFENLGHDFPQTITYTIKGSDSMTAVVEGLAVERPKRRSMEFPMVRVKCN